MNVNERIKKLKMIEKMEKNPIYSKKLGIKDVSAYMNTRKSQKNK